LVYDLGGGTFDVSILELFDGVMEIRASTGDNHLGGEDFVHVLEEGFLAHHGMTAGRLDPRGRSRLREAAERCKLALSESDAAKLVIQRDGTSLAWEVTRDRFHELSADLVRRMRGPIERAMRDCRLAPGDLDAIILAGGATRMPLVREMVVRMFGVEPECSLDPDKVIARGAAIQAGLKRRDEALEDVVMTDVCPYTLSIEVSRPLEGGQFKTGFCAPIIERNTVIPASRVESFSPVQDGQTNVIINVFQGEALMTADNILLGSLNLPLARGTKQESLFDVRFTYDINGILEVEAETKDSRHRKREVFTLGAEVMSEDEIRRRLAALAGLKIHPRDHQENRLLLARGERLHAEFIGPRRQLVAEVLAGFQIALDSQDPKVIERARWELGRALDRICGEAGLEE
jgi:molecular chaperone HscC